MNSFIINFSNIHCEKCELAIRRVLGYSFHVVENNESTSQSEQANQLNNKEIIFNLNGNEVKLIGNNKLNFQSYSKSLLKQFEKAGFNILSWEILKGDEIISNSQVIEMDITEQQNEHDGFFDIVGLFQKFSTSKSEKNHLKYCQVCQAKSGKKVIEESSITNSSEETIVEIPHEEFRASFLVSGMTCSSCSQSVNEALKAVLGDNGSPSTDEPNFSVDLIQQSIVAIIPNKQLINKIIDTVGDLGFECKLIEVLPVHRSINTRVTAIIGGITCAACANSIQSAVNELPFVLECGVNVVTKTAQFVLEDTAEDSSHLDQLKEMIENCGFDFTILKNEKINYTSRKKKPRSINIKVNGMFCNHCPDVITEYLSNYGEAVVIEDPISLNDPYIKFTYVSSKEITIRKFLYDLNHIRSTDTGGYIIDEDAEGPFTCELVKPMTTDEHLQRLARREVISIAARLILATLLVIPTFVFGIVAMSLLPKSHPFRIWVEEPLWVGNVSRNSWILFILATPVYFFAADTFHRKAIKEIKSLWMHKNSFKTRLFKFGSMNLLMSLGTSVAYFASIVLIGLSAKQAPMTHHGFHTTYFDSVVFLTFFLLIGKLLQSYSKIKTADSISQLSNLKPNQATLLTKDYNSKYHSDEKVDLDLLEVGDYIRIATGESPPVDCTIIEGTSDFDESALTGESTPVKHIPGHQIFSGTVNIGNNSIIARVISLESDSLLNQIVNTVRDGQLRKAPMERTADLITGYFVPVIVFLAIITWLIWLILGVSGALPESYLDIDIGGWPVWSLEFAIAVFVVACPCGIGLAAPTALFVGSGLAARFGILAKGGGSAFQDGANTDTVCFDKTGTLTKGELVVTDYSFVNGGGADGGLVSKTIGLQVMRDLEVSSNHPLAKAIKSFADYVRKKDSVVITGNKVPNVETIPGKGLKGKIVYEENDESSIWNEYSPTEAILGNEKLLEDYKVGISQQQTSLLTKWKSECKSIVLIAIQCQKLFNNAEFHLVLMVAARDEIRPETKQVIQFLQRKQIDCWMITGDNSVTAQAIADEIGIKNVVSEVLPDEKESQIKRIRQLKPNAVIAMVGDGINDAPALASADVGVALSSGADLAVTSSDFILLNKSHPLISLVTLFDLARVVFRRVKFNFGWSLVYNMIGLPIAAGVIFPYKNSRLDPVWASAAMALSSISVVLSSLALKLYKPKFSAKDFQLNDSEVIEPKEEFI
ncbi:uncharacterized protein J8A68_003452 [[Candida] subhashii]|uniref:HMA domain-containing protein n=1 Tax=[Candida] subhashii TaxID=561895 RepID=A0A8J5QVK3_9ASCO|nr:uncharacterized protein J8A68_003452 [[Candida] subhashii]KAG7663025.1 hypothetical protein J8A68_003452 [[Candida] subhashii]